MSKVPERIAHQTTCNSCAVEAKCTKTSDKLTINLVCIYYLLSSSLIGLLCWEAFLPDEIMRSIISGKGNLKRKNDDDLYKF